MENGNTRKNGTKAAAAKAAARGAYNAYRKAWHRVECFVTRVEDGTLGIDDLPARDLGRCTAGQLARIADAEGISPDDALAEFAAARS